MAKKAAALRVIEGGPKVADQALERFNRRLPGLNLDNMPKVDNILSYRSVWVLAQLSRDQSSLRATHYAVCLVMGRPPVWGVFTINGKFLRYASGRGMIQEAYPNHVWRRVHARWQFNELDPSKSIERKNYMLTKYGA